MFEEGDEHVEKTTLQGIRSRAALGLFLPLRSLRALRQRDALNRVDTWFLGFVFGFLLSMLTTRGVLRDAHNERDAAVEITIKLLEAAERVEGAAPPYYGHAARAPELREL